MRASGAASNTGFKSSNGFEEIKGAPKWRYPSDMIYLTFAEHIFREYDVQIAGDEYSVFFWVQQRQRLSPCHKLLDENLTFSGSP